MQRGVGPCVSSSGALLCQREFPASSRPSALEVACGLTLGADRSVAPLVVCDRPPPRRAIESSVRRALRRPPCLVAFSGGRDSSAILAIAALVARREGLPLPIPITHRFPAATGSREDEWQELVVDHLGLPEWVRMAVDVDAVGPFAQRLLRTYGVLWPFNAHFLLPIFEQGAGGSVLTGVGGDEVLGAQPWSTARAIVSRRRRPRLADAPLLTVAIGPRWLRRAVLKRRREISWPWLRPSVQREVNRRRATWQAAAPLSWQAALSWWWRSRSRVVVEASLKAVANLAGTQVIHPFHDPTTVGAIAAHFGAAGPADREEAMATLFADVLPVGLVRRQTKAYFDEAFFADASRAFLHTWTGTGIDESLVDVERLATVWRSPRPDPRSFLLLQAACLAHMPDPKERNAGASSTAAPG